MSTVCHGPLRDLDLEPPHRASGLEKSAIHSMISTLGWLKYESNSQAGRGLAASLEERLYAGDRPVAFFTKCYELRSALVHGTYPCPSRDEVDGRAATLQHFVGHLICGPLLEGVADD